MESIDSSTCSLQLPPGFRFHPTDEELVVHYLKKKSNSLPLPASIIAEIDLYKFDPWELPAKASFGEEEWYFFSPRDRKYPNGARPNRAATSGYWKATGTDKPVLTARGTQKVGVKKALVFYQGKPPKGIKTSWIMHEYRLMDNNKSYSLKPPGCDHLNKKGSLRLDDWVLCRIYKKNSVQRPFDLLEIREDNESMMMGSIPPNISQNRLFQGDLKNSNNYASFDLENDQQMYERINFPAKRATLQNIYWNNINEDSSSSKRSFLVAENHHESSNNIMNGRLSDEQRNCIATPSTILNQLPQSSSDDQAVLGTTTNNVGDQGHVLGQQQFNWYT